MSRIATIADSAAGTVGKENVFLRALYFFVNSLVFILSYDMYKFVRPSVSRKHFRDNLPMKRWIVSKMVINTK